MRTLPVIKMYAQSTFCYALLLEILARCGMRKSQNCRQSLNSAADWVVYLLGNKKCFPIATIIVACDFTPSGFFCLVGNTSSDHRHTKYCKGNCLSERKSSFIPRTSIGVSFSWLFTASIIPTNCLARRRRRPERTIGHNTRVTLHCLQRESAHAEVERRML